MKVGFFGGSFDPIHLGHLNLAIQMLEVHKLDEILFCPTSASPHKLQAPPKATKEARAAMVKLAIHPIPSFTFHDSELNNSGPSFTIDTLRALAKQKKQVKYYLILGQDSLQKLNSWKEWEELLLLANPLIGARDAAPFSFPPKISALIQQGMTPTRLMDISSTEIRSRLKQGLYCGHLIPEQVEIYIHKHKLYST